MPRKRNPEPPARRFHTTLTRELLDQLCETHEQGRDFRNVTATRCGVHPKILTRWLNEGRDSDNAGLRTELFMRFGAIEGDQRALWLKEVADPIAETSESEENDYGSRVSKKTVRRTDGIRWLLGARYRQFKTDYLPKPDELPIVDMLDPQPQALNQELALQVIAMIADHPERLPPAVREVFSSKGWTLPVKETHAETATSGETQH